MEENKNTPEIEEDAIEILEVDEEVIELDEEVIPEPFQKKPKHSRSDIFRYAVLVVAAVVFLYALFNIIKILNNYHKGDKEYSSVKNKVFTSDEPASVIIDPTIMESVAANDDSYKFLNYDHAALVAINSEAQGYLDIPAIDITVPIALGTDNEYYLDHAITKAYHSYGCPFIDYRITDGLKARNPIIYGHSMKNGAMFGKLTYYLKQDFYNEKGNRYIYLYCEEGILIYEIFSVYICNAHDSSTYTLSYEDNEAYARYVSTVKGKSRYDTGVDVSGSDNIITLSTCYDDKELRLIVHAKSL